MSYAILYTRPDGWWIAGAGFESREEATLAAEEHQWTPAPWHDGDKTWKVVRAGSVAHTSAENYKPVSS